MALQKGGFAPYAPAATVIQVVDRYRNHGLTTPIDLDVLMRAGVPESLASRTQQAMRSLELIDNEGVPTNELESLSNATSDEYPKVWAEIVRNAYADVFAFVDPAKDPPERVHDAFRGYTPKGQRGRMVTLFLGLCEQAEIIDSVVRRAPGPKPTKRTAGRIPAARAYGGGDIPTPKAKKAKAETGVPPALMAVLDQLPAPGSSWTSSERDTFIKAFSAMLDLVVPVSGTVDSGTRKALLPGSA